MRPSLVRLVGLLAVIGAGGLVGGCTSDEWPPLPAADSGSSGAPSDDEEDPFAGARLEIVQPASPSIHAIGASIPLEARLLDPGGLVLPVQELPAGDAQWVEDGTPLLDGLEGAVELPPGAYELGALVRLPGGDRLQATVGGVRVQARWTGVYAGEVTLDIEASLPGGGPLSLRCVGPLDMRVSLDGRTVDVDDGSCRMEAFGQTIDVTYAIEIVVYDAGLVRGTVDFGFDTSFGNFELPIEWAGAFYDDRFSGGLSGALELPFLGEADASGSLKAQRVDPWVEPDEG